MAVSEKREGEKLEKRSSLEGRATLFRVFLMSCTEVAEVKGVQRNEVQEDRAEVAAAPEAKVTTVHDH